MLEVFKCCQNQSKWEHLEAVEASQRAFAAFSAETGIVAWGDAEFGGDSSGVPRDVHVLEIKSTSGRGNWEIETQSKRKGKGLWKGF